MEDIRISLKEWGSIPEICGIAFSINAGQIASFSFSLPPDKAVQLAERIIIEVKRLEERHRGEASKEEVPSVETP